MVTNIHANKNIPSLPPPPRMPTSQTARQTHPPITANILIIQHQNHPPPNPSTTTSLTLSEHAINPIPRSQPHNPIKSHTISFFSQKAKQLPKPPHPLSKNPLTNQQCLKSGCQNNSKQSAQSHIRSHSKIRTRRCGFNEQQYDCNSHIDGTSPFDHRSLHERP